MWNGSGSVTMGGIRPRGGGEPKACADCNEKMQEVITDHRAIIANRPARETYTEKSDVSRSRAWLVVNIALAAEMSKNGALLESLHHMRATTDYHKNQCELHKDMNLRLVTQHDREMKDLRDLLAKMEDKMFNDVGLDQL